MQGFSPLANALGTAAYTIRSPTEEVRAYVRSCVCVSVSWVSCLRCESCMREVSPMQGMSRMKGVSCLRDVSPIPGVPPPVLKASVLSADKGPRTH